MYFTLISRLTPEKNVFSLRYHSWILQKIHFLTNTKLVIITSSIFYPKKWFSSPIEIVFSTNGPLQQHMKHSYWNTSFPLQNKDISNRNIDFWQILEECHTNISTYPRNKKFSPKNHSLSLQKHGFLTKIMLFIPLK